MLRKITCAILVAVPMVSHADLSPTQQDLTKLYLASFLRAPDLGGLNYWNAQLTSGSSLQTVGGTIFSIPIVREIYPENMSDKDFVEAIYQNVFGRKSDVEGLNYWMDEMAASRLIFELSFTDDLNAYRARGQLVMNMINAGLGTVDGTDGKAYIVNRLNVAKLAADEQLKRGVEIPPEKLKTIGACVDANSTSTTAATDEISSFFSPMYTLGGTISGLATGQSFTLKHGCSNAYVATGNGAFVFNQGLAKGVNYSVTVGTQPAGQTCTVSNGTGVASSSNVTNILVICDNTTIPPDPDKVLNGYFRDSGVSGLDYIACDAGFTKCLSGVTDANGQFSYREGYTVKLTLGNSTIANMKAVPIITPVNATNTPEQAAKLARFLQMLDSDGNLSNGIEISKSDREIAKTTRRVDFFQDMSENDLNTLANAYSKPLPGSSRAVAHMQSSEIVRRMGEAGIRDVRWFTNNEPMSSDMNKAKLDMSAVLRLRYASWLQNQNILLYTSSSLQGQSDKINKVASQLVENVKTYANVITLDLKALDEKGFKIEKLTSIGDTGKVAVDIIANGAKTVYVLGGEEDAPALLEQGAGALKATLSIGNVASKGKEVFLIASENELHKNLAEITLPFLEAINRELLSGKIPDFKKLISTVAIDEAAVASKLAFAMINEITKTQIASRYDFAFNYLDAYFKSGGDEKFMKDKFSMPLNLDQAVSEKLTRGVGEIILGDGLWWSVNESYAKDIVNRYLKYVEETALNKARAFNGVVSSTEMDVSFRDDSGVEYRCARSSAQEYLVTKEFGDYGAYIVPEKIVWDIPSSVSSYLFGAKALLTFNNSGVYTIDAYAWKNGVVSPFHTGKTYLVKNCVEDVSGGKIEVTDGSDGTYFTPKPDNGYKFYGWVKTKDSTVVTAYLGDMIQVRPSEVADPTFDSFKPVFSKVELINIAYKFYTLPAGVKASDIDNAVSSTLSVIYGRIRALTPNESQAVIEMQNLINGITLTELIKMKSTPQLFNPFLEYYFGYQTFTSLSQLPGIYAAIQQNCAAGQCVPGTTPPPQPTGKLNDTGIVTCGTPSTAATQSNSLACTDPAAATPAQQDAKNGRDDAAQQGTLTKVGGSTPNNGKANGFDFTKIGSNGQPLAIQNGTWNAGGSEAAGTKWDCVRDNVTGLLWENKSDDNGLRDKDWTYTWYNSNPATNGGNAGTASGGSCFASGRCDTEKFVADVNAAGLCGHSDWRMPSKEEIQGIVDSGRNNPAIDIGYFPDAVSNAPVVWSALSIATNPSMAWNVSFSAGTSFWISKANTIHSVRLVRGQ